VGVHSFVLAYVPGCHVGNSTASCHSCGALQFHTGYTRTCTVTCHPQNNPTEQGLSFHYFEAKSKVTEFFRESSYSQTHYIFPQLWELKGRCTRKLNCRESTWFSLDLPLVNYDWNSNPGPDFEFKMQMLLPRIIIFHRTIEYNQIKRKVNPGKLVN